MPLTEGLRDQSILSPDASSCLSLTPGDSACGPPTSKAIISGDCMRNAASRAPPRPAESEQAFLCHPQGIQHTFFRDPVLGRICLKLNFPGYQNHQGSVVNADSQALHPRKVELVALVSGVEVCICLFVCFLMSATGHLREAVSWKYSVQRT